MRAVALIISICLAGLACDSAPAEPPLQVDADLDGLWDFEDPSPDDTDNDGLLNSVDHDDDNDGVLDTADAFPFEPLEWTDTDGDDIGNNADGDDDGDGILDGHDVFPLVAAEWLDTDTDGTGNNADPDDDGDGYPDAIDLAPTDANAAGDWDGDDVDSMADLDDDNDGYLDAVEQAEGSDAFSAVSVPVDSDGDGLTDQQEIAWGSNTALADSDGDSLSDKIEYFLQTNPNAADSDGDGRTDAAEVGGNLNALPDLDHDGVIDALDAYRVVNFRALEANPTEAHERFGVIRDVAGRACVANYLSDHIACFDLTGDAQIVADGLTAPNDCGALPNDGWAVADTVNNRIVTFSADGAIETIHEHQPDGLPGGFLSPRGVAVDTGGNFYVADTWNNRVQRYTAATGAWEAFGGTGSGSGEFLDPQDIAVRADGVMAVADTGNYRVVLLTASGASLAVIDAVSLGLPPLTFQPRSLAYGPEDALFIVEAAASRVIAVDTTGALVRQFGQAGMAEGEFLFPTGIDVSTDGRVLVSDRFRVQEF